jgi:hypothetical protein
VNGFAALLRTIAIAIPRAVLASDDIPAVRGVYSSDISPRCFRAEPYVDSADKIAPICRASKVG